MQVALTETVYSLVGVTPILDSISEDVISPFHRHKYGPSSPEDEETPPKFILASGELGAGKKSLCSAIVNELRRGSCRKRGDIFYENRDVKYFRWESNMYFEQIPDYMRKQFEAAKDPSRDLTVFRIDSCHLWFEADHGHFSTFLQELDAVPAGKVLVIGSTTNPTIIQRSIKDRMQFHYQLPYPNEEARGDFMTAVLEEERAKLHHDVTVDYLVSRTKTKFPFGKMKTLILNAIKAARNRLRGDPRNLGAVLSEVTLELKDFNLPQDSAVQAGGAGGGRQQAEARNQAARRQAAAAPAAAARHQPLLDVPANPANLLENQLEHALAGLPNAIFQMVQGAMEGAPQERRQELQRRLNQVPQNLQQPHQQLQLRIQEQLQRLQQIEQRIPGLHQVVRMYVHRNPENDDGPLEDDEEIPEEDEEDGEMIEDIDNEDGEMIEDIDNEDGEMIEDIDNEDNEDNGDNEENEDIDDDSSNENDDEEEYDSGGENDEGEDDRENGNNEDDEDDAPNVIDLFDFH